MGIKIREQRPHIGPQEKFLSSAADIAIYGGAAGGGKTWSLLAEAGRFHYVPKFSAVIFRQTYSDVTNPGGLWDESMGFYPYLGAKMRMSALQWEWPTTAKVQFSHFQHPKYKLNWQGSQICMIGWDELTHFSQDIFFYMLSRNRSTCGVRPYVRCTCNPDPDSWVRDFIDWWIGADGLPIPERDGVIRYFIRDGDHLDWRDNREDFPKRKRRFAKSVTFIAAKLTDNPTLMRADPNYMGNLMALPTHERERLLGGNWNIRLAPGMYFKREMFEIVQDAPQTGDVCRFWDRAATEPHETNPDPDWTVGLKIRKAGDGYWYIEDVVRGRWRPSKVRQVIRNTASQDGSGCVQVLEQEPGASGKSEVQYLIEELEGFHVEAVPANKSKEVRAAPAATAAGVGNIRVVRGSWNKAFFSEAEAFPNPKVHDDQVDGFSGSFNYIALAMKSPRVRRMSR